MSLNFSIHLWFGSEKVSQTLQVPELRRDLGKVEALLCQMVAYGGQILLGVGEPELPAE